MHWAASKAALAPPTIRMTFTLQTPTTDNRGFHEALAGEVFHDLDRARLAALELCSCFGVDVELIQHFGAAS